MPTNLNALIRYKQIDACLKNPYVKCTIERLQEVCTEALSESRGSYKLVSERTIRDDIRVMRSSILGFNAPIEFDKINRVYFYTDKNYSIFSTPLTEINLLTEIFRLLINERNNLPDSKVNKLLLKISLLINEPIPSNLLAEIDENKSKENLVAKSLLPNKKSMRSFNKEDKYTYDLPDSNDETISYFMPPPPSFLWKEILDIL